MGKEIPSKARLHAKAQPVISLREIRRCGLLEFPGFNLISSVKRDRASLYVRGNRIGS